MSRLYRIICGVVLLLGLNYLVRLFISRHRATFILYHDPAPGIFKTHLQYLSQHYSLISLSEYLAYRKDPMVSLPPFPLVITFDDGHRRNAALLGVINQFKIRPTIYVCSGIVGTYRKFWFKLNGIDVQRLKRADHADRLRLLTSANFSTSHAYDDDPQALQLDELLEMREWVDFQSHTVFHPILTTCDAQTVEFELIQSKKELELKISQPVHHFAYPNGDYSEREIALLQKAGYNSARTTDIGWNSRSTNPFRLKITGVNDQAPIWMLKAELTGIPGYCYNLYKSGISLYSLKGRHVPERKL